MIWIISVNAKCKNSFPGRTAGKEFACNAGEPGLIPELGRSPGEGLGYPLQYSWTSLVAQMIKNLPVMQETWTDSWIWKIPWRRAWQPAPVFLPGWISSDYYISKKKPKSNSRKKLKTIFYSMSWITSSVKDHIVNILSFEGHISLSKLLNSAIIVQKPA